VGMGRIGRAVANIASAFSMAVLGYDRERTDDLDISGFQWTEMDELFSKSDIVSLHCPLTEETKGIINRDSLRMMKQSAFLINTSRGPLVVEPDLAGALNEGVIAGAGLDVLSTEPPSPGNPLLSAKNCLITPHIAWATKEARGRLMDIAVSNVRAFLSESLENVINQ
jgi:glycerate dehydrogenase